MIALTDFDFDAVARRSAESWPPDHERPWAGSPGGAWRFWNRIHRHRQTHPYAAVEVAAA